MCGQHPSRMSGVGDVTFMPLLFYMFQSILNIFAFMVFFCGEKLINYMENKTWSLVSNSR